MQTHVQATVAQPNAHQSAVESLASAVVGLAAQRQHLRDHRQRAQRSSLVNQALQAYRDCLRLQADPAG